MNPHGTPSDALSSPAHGGRPRRLVGLAVLALLVTGHRTMPRTGAVPAADVTGHVSARSAAVPPATAAETTAGKGDVRTQGALGDTAEDTPYRLDLVAQTGGAARAAEADPADPTVVYLALGPRVVAVDVSDPAAPRFLGRSDVLPGVVEDLAVGGDIVFAVFDAGTAIDSSGGVAAIGAGDPTRPRVLGLYQTDASLRRVVLAGDLVIAGGNVGGFNATFTGSEDGLVVVDAGDPGAMREIFRTSIGDENVTMLYKQPVEAAVLGSTAFLARRDNDRGAITVLAFDLSDPSTVAQSGRLTLSGDIEVLAGTAVVGTHLLVATAPRSGRPLTIHAVDVASPAAMRTAGTVNVPGPSCAGGWRAAALPGNRLAAVDKCGRTLQRFDLSDPDRPRVVDTTPVALPAGDVTAVAGVLVVAAGDAGGLRTYSDGVSAPTPLGTLDTIGAVSCVMSASGRIYGTDPDGGVFGIGRDAIGTAVAPQVRRPGPAGACAAVSDDRVLVADPAGGAVHVARVDALGNLADLASIETGGEVTGFAVAGDRAYIAAGDAGVLLVDPRSGEVRATNDALRATAIAADEAAVVVYSLNHSFTVLDPASLAVRDSREPRSSPSAETSAVAVSGARAYFAMGGLDIPFGFVGMLEVFDTTAPGLPSLGQYDVSSLAGPVVYRVAADADHVLAGGDRGIAALGVSADGLGDTHAVWNSPGTVLDLVPEPDDGSGRRGVLVADGAGGMVELDLVPSTVPTPTPSPTAEAGPTRTVAPTAPPTAGPPPRPVVFLPLVAADADIFRKETTLRLEALVDAPALDFAWVGDVVFRTEGMQLVALDVSDPSTVREIGRSADLGDLAWSVDVAGDLAVVTLGEAGVAFLDVADPAAMRVVASFPAGGAATDAVIAGRYAYVATDAALRVFDVGSPARPSAVGRVSVEDGLTHVAVHEGFLYGLDDDVPVRIYDLATPERAVEVARPAIEDWADSILGISFAGDLALVQTNLLIWTFDVTDPRAPRDADPWAVPGFDDHSAVTTDGTHAYVAAARGLLTFDLSNPHRPTLLGETNTAFDESAGPAGCPGMFTALAVRDGQALGITGSYLDQWYSVFCPPRLRRFEVTDVAAPRLVALEDGLDVPDQVRRDGDALYVLQHAERIESSMFRFDLVAPGRPAKRGSITVPGACDLQVADGVAYVPQSTASGTGLAVLDVGSWPAARVRTTVPLPDDFCRDEWYGGCSCQVAVDDGRAYVVHPTGPTGEAATSVIVVGGLQDPSPEVAATCTFDGHRWAGAVADGDRLVLVGENLGVVDVSDPADPKVLGTLAGVPGRQLGEAPSTGLAVVDGRAYVASQTALSVVDVTEGAPHLVGQVVYDAAPSWGDIRGLPHTGGAPRIDVEIAGDLAFVAAHRLLMFDVADPTAPRQIRSSPGVPLPSRVDPALFFWWGMAAADDFLYVGTRDVTGQSGQPGFDRSLGLGVVRVRR